MEKMWKFWKSGDKSIHHWSNDTVETKIQQWLWEEDFELKKMSDDKSTFRYLITKSGLPNSSVNQYRNKHDSIFITSGIGFRGINATTLQKVLDPNQNVAWEIRRYLASKGFFYKIQTPNLHTNNPGGIIFTKQVFYDGFTKDRLLNTVFQVAHTTAFIITTLQRHTTDPGEKSTTRPYLS